MRLPIREPWRIGQQVPNQSSILAIDPGLRTGIAVYQANGAFASYESSDWYVVSQFIGHEVGHGWVDALVCENFIIGGRAGVTTAQPWSLELIGVFRYLCRLYQIPFVLQPPAERMGFTTAHLRKLGWYQGHKGEYEGHADDAARHLGAYLMKQGDQDFLKRIYE